VAHLFTDGTGVKLYADDVKLYLEIENDSDIATLQQSIDKFVKWGQTWQLSLSSQKCCHVTFVEHINMTVAKAHRRVNQNYSAFPVETSLCGRDGRTICGPLRQPKSTYVTLAHKRKQTFFYFGCSLVRRF